MVGLWKMQPFGAAPSSGDGPVLIYYAGVGVGVVAMFVVIILLLKKQVLAVTPDDIVIGDRRRPRHSMTSSLRPWRRLGRTGTLLELWNGSEVWRIGTPRRPRTSGGRRPAALAPWKLNLRVSALDFDELLARLGLPEVPPPVAGIRWELQPFRSTARGALAGMRPWFLTILILGALGPTVGPFVSRFRFANIVLPTATLLIALLGMAATIVPFHRPARLLRLVFAWETLTVMDVRSGAPLAAAPLRDLAAERFHFVLLGGRFDRIRLWNPGLRLTFPSGFTVSIALPRRQRWPDRVTRARAPRWTLTPDAARELLRATHAE